MKKTVVFIFLLNCANIFAQTPTTKPPVPVPVPVLKGEKTSNLADTIISKDPVDPSRDYWTIHNVKGLVSSEGPMLNGRKEGTWKEYVGATGVISKLEQYHMGRKHGLVMEFSFIGQVTSESSYLNDTLNGRRVICLQSGKAKVLENYKNGVLDGSRKSFYDDSKIQEEATYRMGQRIGTSRWYTQTGKPKLEYTYDKGELNGPAKEYDENGLLKREGNYINNDEDGEWKVYQDSTLEKKIIYKSGKIIKEVQVKK